MEDFTKKRERLYLAYLEEKCHIHPTAEVEFEEDEDVEYSNITIYPRIGGFDCGIRFTDGDILTWLIEQDIKPSEVKDYSNKITLEEAADMFDKDFLNEAKKDAEEHPVQINKEAIEKLKEVRPNEEFNIRSAGNTEIEFLIEEKRRDGGGSFEYDDTLYTIDKDGSVTTKNIERPKYNTAKDAWFDAVKKGNPPRFG